MATYTDLFQQLEQDPEHAARRDALLTHAQAAFWASTTRGHLDDDIFVIFALIGRALDTARLLRGVAVDNQEEVERLNFLLTQALEVQNYAILHWCDGQGLTPDNPPLPDSPPLPASGPPKKPSFKKKSLLWFRSPKPTDRE